MNDHFDPFEPTLSMFQQLGRGDRCRALDAMHQIIGPVAPVPALEDITDEARFWAATLDQKTLSIFFDATFQALDPARQKAAIEYLNKLECKKKPPQSG